MAAGAFFFSLMSLLVKVAGARLPTMEVVLVRSVVTLALTSALLWRARMSPWGRERKLLLLRGALGFVALSCFYYAVIHLPLADATVIQYTNPVFTALFAALVLSERIGPREVLLALGSLAGVVVMTRPALLFGGAGAALPPLAVAIALGGAVFSAAAYTTVRRLGRSEHHLVIVFYFALVSTVGAAPFTAVDFVLPVGWEWLLLLGIGVTTQLGQVFLTLGLREERAGKAMAVGYLQIVFAAAWGWVILTEIPDRWTAAGALVIVGCTWLLARLRPRLPATPDPAAPSGPATGP
jgi:drug/metabolite transporter (DMT)-like permease